MRKFAAVVLFCLGACVAASATAPTPEIDPVSGANALALIGGAIIVYRGRRRN